MNKKFLYLEVNTDLTLSLIGNNINVRIANPKHAELKAIKPKDPIKATKATSLLNHFFQYVCAERTVEEYEIIVTALIDFFSSRSLNGFDTYILNSKHDNRTSLTMARDYTFCMVRDHILSDDILGIMLDYIEAFSFNDSFHEDDSYGCILRLEDTYIFVMLSIIHKLVAIFCQLLVIGRENSSAMINTIKKNIKKFTLLNSADIIETFIIDRYPSANSYLKFVERLQGFISTNSERDVVRNTIEIQDKFIAIGSDLDTIIDAVFSEVISSTGTFSASLNYNNILTKAETDELVEAEKAKYELESSSAKPTGKADAATEEVEEEEVDYDEVIDDEDGGIPKKEVLNAAKLPYRIGLDYTKFGFNARNTTGYIQNVRKSAASNNTIKRKFKCIADTYDSEIHSIIQSSESVRLDHLKDEELDKEISSKIKAKLGKSALAYYDECMMNDNITPNVLSRFVIRQIIQEDFGVSLARMSYPSQVLYIIYAQCSSKLEKKEKLKDAILGGEQSGSANQTLTIDFRGTPFEFNDKMKQSLLGMIRRAYISKETGTFIPSELLAIEIEDFIRGR